MWSTGRDVAAVVGGEEGLVGALAEEVGRKEKGAGEEDPEGHGEKDRLGGSMRKDVMMNSEAGDPEGLGAKGGIGKEALRRAVMEGQRGEGDLGGLEDQGTSIEYQIGELTR